MKLSALRKKLNFFGDSSEWKDGITPSIGGGDAKMLIRLLNKVKRENMAALEVGSWVGNGSTRVITNHIRDLHAVFYCVDTWAGSENVPFHQEFRKRYNTFFEVFADNVRAYNGQDIVRPLVMPSTQACVLFPDKSLDFVFIDGNHGYSYVKQDILAWLPKIKPGGVICGHDCDACYADLDPKLRAESDPHVEDDYYENKGHPGPKAFHAGVVKAVHEVFDGKATLWFKLKGSTSVWSHRPGSLMDRLRVSIGGGAPASREESVGGKAWPKPTPWPAAN
ncbi:MAG: class I SAM-dependent methyltransferase [Verrucomicrobia bacterium]|nr:class I SAM-dependent methyltransferase [Verrucomicrobiota bacterium]